MTYHREAAHPVDALHLERWSPRAFDGSDIPERDMLSIFEAARWAPSSFNYQPWRFLYARRGDPHWVGFLDLLIEANRSWAHNASLLLFALSDSIMQVGGDAQPSHSHSFDTGAAWMALALQATRLGYKAHGMTGVDFDRARITLGVPNRFRIEAAIAIGRQASGEILPERLRSREFPSDRRPIEASFFSGNFVS